MHLLLAVPVGVVIGLSLGALGGGGSILTVPALVYLLGQSPHGATTASLVIVGITAVAGTAAHARKGRVRATKGLVFGVLGVAGSFVGARLSAGVSSDVLLSAFAGLMLVAAAAMALRLGRAVGRRPGPAGSPCPEEPEADPRSSPTQPRDMARVLAAATVVGLLTGFFGVGGGFVVVPALVLTLGFEMPEAVGTSLLVIAVNTAAALLARLGTQAVVDWSVVAVFVLAAVLGSAAGTRVASVARPERLALAFMLLLVGVAVYTAARSVPRLM
jgi:uncharacterized membrane protein YfcA